MDAHVKRVFVVWLALLALLAASAASAWLPLGAWNGVANLVIALVKALLVVLFFMRVAEHGPLARVAVLTAVLTLALLLCLAATDYPTRTMFPAPWTAPPPGQTQARLGGQDGRQLAAWMRSEPDRAPAGRR
jgi:cytochrome c oxidase subunit 4